MKSYTKGKEKCQTCGGTICRKDHSKKENPCRTFTCHGHFRKKDDKK